MSLDHVNLLPRGLQNSSTADLQKALLYGWAAAIVMLAMMSFLKAREVEAKELRYVQLAETAKSMGASVQEITTKMKTSEEANRKFTETREFLQGRVTWTEALKELSLLIPDTV